MKIKNLGLAAYIKIRGCTLTRYYDGYFHFNSERACSDWKIEYSNDICWLREQATHDLRSFYGSESFYLDTENRVWTSDLGLAAYLKALGHKLAGFDSDRKCFHFKCEKDFQQIQIDYSNSRCAQHESEVGRLREIMRANKS